MGFWDELNNNLNRNVNKPVNDWFGQLFKGGNSGGLKTQDFEGSRTPYKTAIASSNPNKQVSFNIGQGNRRVSSSPIPDGPSSRPTYGNKMLSDEADRSRNSGVWDMSPQDQLFNDLIGKITNPWSGIDRSKIDYSPLDAALNAKIGAINGLRDQTNANADKSDLALELMHKAQQDRMGTEGVARYNSIADGQKANLNAVNQQSQQNLQNIKNEDMAKRAAMLKDLGIEAAGAQADPSADILTQAQGSIAARNDANVTNAEADRGTNLAFNQGVINSVGQAGVERRADLQNQLQSILGRLNMSEADAKQQNAQDRYQLEQTEGARQYDQFQNDRGFYTDTARQMEQDAQSAQQAQAKAAANTPSTSGFAGLGQDLLNTGYDPREIQQAMEVLSSVTSSDYMSGIDPNAGYSQAAILNKLLQKNGVTNPMLALQLATNYANLGNVSKYQQSPY